MDRHTFIGYLLWSRSCGYTWDIKATKIHFLEHKGQLSYVSWRGEAEPIDFSRSSGGVTLGQDTELELGGVVVAETLRKKAEIHLSQFCAQWH